MLCTATLGGQIIKIIYEKDNILIFTIRNVKGNKYEYYNIIVKDPTFINLIKENMYKVCTCICALKQKKVGTGNNKFYTYDFILEDINF